MDTINYNYIPKTHIEFAEKANLGLIELNVMNEQFAFLNREIFKHNFLESNVKYKRRILQKMLESEDVFWKVFDNGIDLILKL
jgi:hypothetical protein